MAEHRNDMRRDTGRLARLAGGAALALIVGSALCGGAGSARAASPDQEVSCLARTIYFESRGEPRGGMLAVGHVVMNRSHDPSFPHSICGVVYQRDQLGRCQFTFACDRRSDRPRQDADWTESMTLAKAIYAGRTTDPTRGALWFHRASARSDFGPGIRRTTRIGRHDFYSRRVS